MNNIWSSSVFQLLMIFRTSDNISFWWTTSEDVLLMTSAFGELLLKRCFWWRQLLQNLFLTAQASFLLIPLLLFVLQNLCLKLKTKFFVYGPAHLNKYWHIQLTLLIPCYHQNSKSNVKHILFQHTKLSILILFCPINSFNIINWV